MNKKIKPFKINNSLKILFILSIPYIAVMLNHNGFMALLPFVRDSFDLTRTQIGYYSTSIFLSAAILAVFTGNIVDKIGSKAGMIIGVGCFGLMNILFGLAPSYFILLLFAVIAGLGFSIITPALNKGLMIRTPPHQRAASMGIMQSGSGVGGFAGASLLPLLGELWGWRTTIQIAGLFALLMVLFICALYHDHDQNKNINRNSHKRDDKVPPLKVPPLKDNLIFFLSNKQFLLFCFLGIMLSGASAGSIFTHYAIFLSEDLQLSRIASGLGLGVVQVGGIIGRPALGWVSDRFFKGHRSKALVLVGFSTGIMYLLYGFVFDNYQFSLAYIYSVTFVLGFFAFGWTGIYFVAVAEIGGEIRTGGATGMALLFIRVGIFAAPPIFGYMADTSGNYYFSWLTFGLALILATLVFYKLKQ